MIRYGESWCLYLTLACWTGAGVALGLGLADIYVSYVLFSSMIVWLSSWTIVRSSGSSTSVGSGFIS